MSRRRRGASRRRRDGIWTSVGTETRWKLGGSGAIARQAWQRGLHGNWRGVEPSLGERRDEAGRLLGGGGAVRRDGNWTNSGRRRSCAPRRRPDGFGTEVERPLGERRNGGWTAAGRRLGGIWTEVEAPLGERRNEGWTASGRRLGGIWTEAEPSLGERRDGGWTAS